MKIKFRRLHIDARPPVKGHKDDAAFDLTATAKYEDHDPFNGTKITYDTGIALEIPQGYYGQLHARSSIHRSGLWLCNSVGIIDSGYRGEIKFMFYSKDKAVNYLSPNVGDRVGQILILPVLDVEFSEVDFLSKSERGTGGFGSTGK